VSQNGGPHLLDSQETPGAICIDSTAVHELNGALGEERSNNNNNSAPLRRPREGTKGGRDHVMSWAGPGGERMAGG
jgi:hypothetical protein